MTSILPSELPLIAFRQRITDINEDQHRYAIILSYLGAARANEVCGLSLPSDKHSVALGPTRANVSYQHMEDGSEALLLNLKIEKRKGHPIRTVALPLGVEPWANYLGTRFDRFGATDLLLPFNRVWLSRILKRYGFVEPKNSSSRRNPLRHDRINHLMSDYRFTIPEVTIYAGWDLATASRAFGGSSTLSEYAHFRWTEYYGKLLRPLPTT